MEAASKGSILPVRGALLDALEHLERANRYALNVAGDPWQFAVEWTSLESRGIDLTDVRWLVAKNFIELRREVSVPAAFKRVFVECDADRLTPDSVFKLTVAGSCFLHGLRGVITESLPDRNAISPDCGPAQRAAGRPRWDVDRRELLFRGRIVKQFRVPAANQELILTAFEEEGWPAFVDDPLPRKGHDEPGRRLQATIKSLNRRQSNAIIRFRGNGGEKVLWEEVVS